MSRPLPPGAVPSARRRTPRGRAPGLPGPPHGRAAPATSPVPGTFSYKEPGTARTSVPGAGPRSTPQQLFHLGSRPARAAKTGSDEKGTAMTDCTRESGTCQYCRDGCTRKPGWFLPGEAEAAAAFMGMTLPEFFTAYLAVDWWVDFPDDIFVLSPAVQGRRAGTEFPANPRGTCVFYENERCRIHPVKPAECREHWCGDKRPSDIHHDVAQAWADRQGQIRELLGREPESESYDGGGIFGLLGL